MAGEKGMFVDIDPADYLSDVPIDDSIDWEDGLANIKREVESSDDGSNDTASVTSRSSDAMVSDSEDSEDDSAPWTDIDLPRNNYDFVGSFGPKVFPTKEQSIEEIVELFIGKDLFELISLESNKYYKQSRHLRKIDKKNVKFVKIAAVELRKWFGLVILMGIIKKTQINDYWSRNPLTDTPIFRKIMSRNRFRQILSYLHFSDNSQQPENADRLIKVQPLIEYFSKKFAENFNVGQNISIDETMIPWRGQLSFKVYNPSKIIKHGILTRMLCDSNTGYISSFSISTGTGQNLDKTVMELLQNSFGKWHHLYMDNNQSSVNLANKLLKKKVRVCGTVRQQRECQEKLKIAKLKVFEEFHKRKGEILTQSWRASKQKVISMISTIHNATLVDTRSGQNKCVIKKPASVIDYNKYMKGAERADHYLSCYPLYRKSIKWPKKVGLYLFNCALFNAFKTWEYFNKEHKGLRFPDFLLKVAEIWLKDSLSTAAQTSQESSSLRSSQYDACERLSGQIKQHYLVKISQTEKRVRRNCRVCYKNKKRSLTSYMCKTCGAALHLENCFAAYHLKENY